MRSLLNLCDSLSLFLLTVLNLSYWALLKSFIVLTVVTERDTQFEHWMEDDRQPQRGEEFTQTSV